MNPYLLPSFPLSFNLSFPSSQMVTDTFLTFSLGEVSGPVRGGRRQARKVSVDTSADVQCVRACALRPFDKGDLVDA